jgi:hypothetical protein
LELKYQGHVLTIEFHGSLQEALGGVKLYALVQGPVAFIINNITVLNDIIVVIQAGEASTKAA